MQHERKMKVKNMKKSVNRIQDLTQSGIGYEVSGIGNEVSMFFFSRSQSLFGNERNEKAFPIGDWERDELDWERGSGRLRTKAKGGKSGEDKKSH